MTRSRVQGPKSRVRSGSLLLVSGGARSGKSRYALSRAAALGGPVLYVATGMATDEEMAERIARHRAERPPTWQTLEASQEVAVAIKLAAAPGTTLLVEDLATLVSNLIVTAKADESRVIGEVDQLVHLAQEGFGLILVTNEVGLGLVPPSPLGRRFRDLLGLVNQRVADAADEFVLVISGAPLALKQPGRADLFRQTGR